MSVRTLQHCVHVLSFTAPPRSPELSSSSSCLGDFHVEPFRCSRHVLHLCLCRAAMDACGGRQAVLNLLQSQDVFRRGNDERFLKKESSPARVMSAWHCLTLHILPWRQFGGVLCACV